MDGIGIKNLQAALRTLVEANVDTGVADATSAVNHLDDVSKSWPVDAFKDLIVEITAGTGVDQMRKIASNTATSLVPVTNFDTAPDATSQYRIGFFGKMTGDITDRAARLLGVIDSLTKWAGTTLTPRDISLDLANLTKLIPLAKAAIFNADLPTAEANWVGTDITPTNSPSYFSICPSVCLSIGVFSMVGLGNASVCSYSTGNLNIPGYFRRYMGVIHCRDDIKRMVLYGFYM
ncbi:unnamed protein product, partial [marine sediment metagenome]